MNSLLNDYKKLDPTSKKICDEWITDQAWTNIFAILRANNNMTMTQYLNICYEVLITSLFSDLLVVLRFCTSHITKNILDEVRKYFRGDQLKQICRMIGPMFNFIDYKDATEYITAFITALSWPNITDGFYVAAMNVIEAKLIDEELDWTFSSNDAIDPAVDDRLQRDMSKSIYRRSPFYKQFKSLAQSLDMAFDVADEEVSNPLRCIRFLEHFLRCQLAFYPCWSNVMTALKFPDAPRADNVWIELSFEAKKKNMRENFATAGKMGSIKMGRYVHVQERAEQAFVKRVLY